MALAIGENSNSAFEHALGTIRSSVRVLPSQLEFTPAINIGLDSLKQLMPETAAEFVLRSLLWTEFIGPQLLRISQGQDLRDDSL